jgi:hypothetical protein
MANVFATKTGQWADTTVWNTGSLPTVNDDVFSNNFTVTISSINPRVLTIRNTAAAGINAGGGFTITDGVSLSAGVVGGGVTSVYCLTFAQNQPASCTLYGNISAFNNLIQTPLAISHSGTGTFTIYGTAVGSVNNGTNPAQSYIVTSGNMNFFGDVYSSTINSVMAGIRNNGINPLNIVGNLFAINNFAAVNNSTGVINITGNAFGGSTSTSYGIYNISSGIIYLQGSAIGGSSSSGFGAFNNSTGTIFIQGSAIGGLGAAGVNNNSTGVVYVTKAVGNGFGLGSTGITSGIVGLVNSQNGRAYVEQVEFGPRGQTPISGPVYILPSNRNTLTGVLTALGNTVTFYNSLSVNGLLPPASSVRLGTVYNVGNSVGTMVVPAPESVEFGVPVDNTVGIAALTPQNVWGYSRLSATDVGSMGDRLRNAATAQSVGSQIASFNL